MKRFLFSIFCMAVAGIASAQYISEVFEYKPAPGQWINVEPWGTQTSMESIKGTVTGTMSLGAFGGYVVFGFQNPVQNDPENPYGMDFTIFGNPYDDWSEPGVVYVMKDENQNGQPDDTWYQLAGSDYFFSSSYKDYEVTYTNPGGDGAVNVPWSDNLGNTGIVEINEFHTQPWYPQQTLFPAIPSSEYTLKGDYVKASVDSTNPASVKSYIRTFGYADNTKRGSGAHTIPDNPYTQEVENSGGDAFDISWAVNDNGEYIDLDEIQFVKVQSAALDNGGWLGEVSTEVCGAVDVAPDNSLAGQNKVLVVADLPLTCTSPTWQLEYALFDNGRLVPDSDVSWTVDMKDAYVDDNDILHLPSSGVFTLSASSLVNPDISCSQTCVAELSTAINSYHTNEDMILFPVPAKDQLFVEIPYSGIAYIFDAVGQLVLTETLNRGTEKLIISHLENGIYLFVLHGDNTCHTEKFIVKR